MINVVSLLTTNFEHPDQKEGEQYFWRTRGSEYAEKLFAGVDRFKGETEVSYYLMTDSPEMCPVGVEVVPLPERHEPGWWAKLYMYKPGVFSGLTLFLDLDNVIYGSLAPLLALNPDPILMTRDTVYPDRQNGAVVLCYPERLPYLYEEYTKNAEGIRKEFNTWPNASEQAYIAHRVHMMTQHPIPMIHDLVPKGFFFDSRMQLEKGLDVTGGSILIGNYRPKPHDSQHPFYQEHWVL